MQEIARARAIKSPVDETVGYYLWVLSLPCMTVGQKTCRIAIVICLLFMLRRIRSAINIHDRITISLQILDQRVL